MTTYSLVYIPSEKYHQPTPGNSLFESIPVSNIDEAENYGNVAYVNGLWFHTYHLDPVSDFDIV